MADHTYSVYFGLVECRNLQQNKNVRHDCTNNFTARNYNIKSRFTITRANCLAYSQLLMDPTVGSDSDNGKRRLMQNPK